MMSSRLLSEGISFALRATSRIAPSSVSGSSHGVPSSSSTDTPKALAMAASVTDLGSLAPVQYRLMAASVRLLPRYSLLVQHLLDSLTQLLGFHASSSVLSEYYYRRDNYTSNGVSCNLTELDMGREHHKWQINHEVHVGR